MAESPVFRPMDSPALKSQGTKTLPKGDTADKLDWSKDQVSKTRKFIGLTPWSNCTGRWSHESKARGEKAPEAESLDALLGSLTQAQMSQQLQTALQLSEKTLKQASSVAQVGGATRSASEPSLRPLRAPKDPDQLLPSHLHGSAKYSFGPGYKRPRHLKGSYKIPVVEPRDPDGAPGQAWVPGPGAYDIRHYFGRDVGPPGGGMTGGWLAGHHDVFLRVFKQDFEQKATPEFYDRLEVLLPEISRLAVAEHVKWFVDYQHHKMNLRHTIEQQCEDKVATRSLNANGEPDVTMAKSLAGEFEASRRRRLHETKRLEQRRAEFYDYASEECKRWNLKPRAGPRDGFKPVQHHGADSGVVDDTLRAHPQFKKSPGYTWSAHGEVRDSHVKRFTNLAEVRTGTHMTNPGPGYYLGIDEQDRIMERRPCYSIPQAGAQYYPMGLAIPNMSLAAYNAEMDRRLSRAGVLTNGELIISLMWFCDSELLLNVVPPEGKFGKPGSLAINQARTSMSGGSFAVALDKKLPAQSVSWPKFLGVDAPPRGDYKVYITTKSGPLAADVSWACRVKIGERKQWYSGIVKSETVGETSVCAFKYDGPVDMSTKIQKDIQLTQLRKPSWKFGKEHGRIENCSAEGNALTNKASTLPSNGPGLYRHATSLVTHF